MADAKSTSSPLMHKIQDIGNQVGQAAANAVKGVKNAADNVGNRTNDFVADATKRASEATNYVKDRAEQATNAMSEQLKVAAEASGQIGQNLRTAGEYLENEGLEGITNDVITLIKKNPVTSVFTGLFVGFCLGRTLYRD